MRGATHRDRWRDGYLCISIHAPHAGRDQSGTRYFDLFKISIHAPHAGRDNLTIARFVDLMVFQSTRPMRGATSVSSMSAPRVSISIHAPHAGRDCFAGLGRPGVIPFQSTRPMRGATRRDADLLHRGHISIHAPHAGRDALRGDPRRERINFNPRAPCGARLVLLSIDSVSS